MTVVLDTLRGAAMLAHLDALARLRAEVFRDWPYLFDATDYDEASYLRSYAEDPEAALVLARDGAAVVGAATCQPMRRASAPVRTAFEAAGRDPGEHHYFGESVLRPEYRGRGVGVGFFAAREAEARRCGARFAAFCAVIRAPADPRRPPGHVPLDAFWRKRGYAHHPGLVCRFRWREVGAAEEAEHALSFWIKAL